MDRGAGGGLADTLRRVRATVMAACPDPRQHAGLVIPHSLRLVPLRRFGWPSESSHEQVSGFACVARHVAAHARNAESIVQAMRQLSDARKRLQEVRHSHANVPLRLV